MKYRQTERAMCIVTFVREVEASSLEKAEQLFDEGCGETVSETVGNIEFVADTVVEPVE